MKSLLNAGWPDDFEGSTAFAPWETFQAELSASVATDQKWQGAQSLKVNRITTNGAGQVYSGADTGAKAVTRVTAGETIQSSVWFRTNRASGTTAFIRHRHYNGTTLLGATDAAAVTVPANTWVQLEHSAVAPATTNGMHFAVITGTLNVGEAFWVDDWAMWHESPGWAPSTTHILNLEGVRQRTDRFRFELCDPDLRPMGDLHPSREATASISIDTSNNPIRRLTGLQLTPDEAADINVLRDRLRVYVTLQNQAEYRLGTFLWADASEAKRSWGAEQHSELVDFSYILDQQSTRAFGWGRGANPIGVIMIFLCFRAGFELADLYPMGKEGDRSLTEPVTWQPGSTWRQMLNDLCSTIGFAPPWFDRDGKMHLDQVPDPAKDAATVPAYGDGTRIVKDSVVFSNGMLSAPNDFAVFDTGTGGLRIGRWQLPSTAPHSFANRGLRIGLTESVQGLSSQAQADKVVRDLARAKGDALVELAFTSTLDPRHDMWDVVPAYDQTWLETSHSMELRSGGAHRHTMKRVHYDVV